MAMPTGLVSGNIKNRLLPFVLNKGGSINTSDIYSSSTSILDSYRFSFKNKDTQDFPRGHINIIPSDRGEFNNDIGLKLLVSTYLKDSRDDSKGLSTLDTILNHIPGILIREYTQDVKLELLWSLVSNLIAGFRKGKEVADSDAKKGKAYMEAYSSYLADSIGARLKSDDFWSKVGEAIGDFFGDSGTYDSSGIDSNMLAIKLVHAFYYRMIGAVTTNVYTLPYLSEDYISSDGTKGWDQLNPFGFSEEGATSSNSLFGKALNFISGNVKIVTEPIWKPEFGSAGTSITLKFSLINDTYEHSISNFLFVNTIVPNNMFLQYGIFLIPPSVYDIKIEGGRRLFMCSGKFKCSNKGVVRCPTKAFLKDLVDNHLNNNTDSFKTKITADYLFENAIVRIPDAYDIEMTFLSVLPDNFNNFIFSFAMNNNIATYSQSGTKGFWYDSKVKSEIEDQIKKDFDAADAAGNKALEDAAAKQAAEDAAKLESK